jgi:glycosyltransferase involved in cell wall biosynthesis
VRVLRNYVDPIPHWVFFADKEPRSKDSGNLTVGYAGGFTHSYDFGGLPEALLHINVRYPNRVKFYFLGHVPAELAAISNLACDVRFLPYEHYVSQLCTRGIDVGLAPLSENLFNACKSNIKFLEYALAGIPAIYSNVGPYRETIQHGTTGFLVEENTVSQWYNALAFVLENPDVLDDVRTSIRRTVDRFFLLKDHYREWWDTYLGFLALRGKEPGSA